MTERRQGESDKPKMKVRLDVRVRTKLDAPSVLDVNRVFFNYTENSSGMCAGER